MNIMHKCVFTVLILINISIFSAELHHLKAPEVKIDKTILSAQGSFINEDGVKEFLKEAYVNGILKNPAFQHKAWLNVKQLGVGGYNTGQLFAITSDRMEMRDSFILKELTKPEEEMERLTALANSPELSPLIYPAQIEGYPQFVLPVQYLAYKDSKGRLHQFSLMDKAPGKSLLELIGDFAQNPGSLEVQKNLIRAYSNLGIAMANFYQRFESHQSDPRELPISILHGDLHTGNVLYDDNRIYLVDNVRIAKYVHKKKTVGKDFAFLLEKSIFLARWKVKPILSHASVQQLCNLTIPSYIAGFLSRYPQELQYHIFGAIKKCLKEYVDPKDAKTLGVFYTHTGTLGFPLSECIDPILKELTAFLKAGRTLNTNAALKGQMPINLLAIPAAPETSIPDKSPLFIAAIQGNIKELDKFLKMGANPNERDQDRNTPLHDAAWYNKPEAIKTLLHYGADINAKNGKGETPLFKAQYNKSNEAEQILLAYGAQ